ncbi:MAG: hypothetical protein ABG776_00640 [Cyanobacteria bacterium J06555_13]
MSTFDDAKEVIRQKLAATAYTLSDCDEAALAAAWRDVTYEQICEESGININTMKGHAAPLLWRRLSDVLGQKVTKKRFKDICLQLMEQSEELPVPAPRASVKSTVHVVGAALPNIENFCGRKKELAHLKKLLQQYSCLVVVGAEGIGKRSIVAKLLCSGNLPFSTIIRRPLHHRPSLEALEADLLSLVGGTTETSLISALNQEPVVLVLESLDSLILDPASRRLGDSYMSLIRRIIEETKAKVIITTTEPIEQLRRQALSGSAAIYTLGGVGLAEARAIVGGDLGGHLESVWQAVGGNPLMLKEIASWSVSVSGIDPSIANRATIYKGLFEELYQQMYTNSRLSTVDRSLLMAVAESGQGVPFSKLLQSHPNAALDIQRLLEMGLLQKTPQSDGPVIRLYEFFRQYLVGLRGSAKKTIVQA